MIHPLTIRALMRRGMSLRQIAVQRGWDVAELDRALWSAMPGRSA